MENILEIEDLRKTYEAKSGPVHALKGITLSVKRGEIFGLLGVNGAGKSTTLNILSGLLEATSGRIMILGKDFFTHEEEIKSRMNIATAYADLPGNLTVLQNLKVFAVMYNIPNHKEKIKKTMEQFEITNLAKSKFGELSAGQKTRVNLCKSFLNDPDILLLDEPTASLDPAIAEKTRKLLLELQSEHQRTIIFTSHNMSEVEKLCDRVALLHKGAIYRIDTPENLIAHHNAPDLEEVFIKLSEGAYDDND